MHKGIEKNSIMIIIPILIVAMLVFFAAIIVIPKLISNTHMPQVEACDVSVLSELELPDSKIIAIGTPTHGNAEPIKLTLEILKKVYWEYGSVAFILEEVAGDADTINKQHSYTKEDGSKVGMYLVYDNDEISEILNWLEQTNQRFYGIDVQSVSETAKILSERLEDLNFSDAERILNLPVKNEAQIKLNTPFLDTIAEFVDEQTSTGRISEQERAYLLHLLDCIKMNYEYVLSDYSFEVRDELMARNVEWIMEYEKSYYDNDHAVIFASNGHVIKAKWSYAFSKKEIYIPMGTLLSEKFDEDYYVILTDAWENYFEAGANMKDAANKKVFHIYNDQLESVAAEEQISVIMSDDCISDDNQDWKLVIIGSVFNNFRSHWDTYYSTRISTEESCNIIICFELMTPTQSME